MSYYLYIDFLSTHTFKSPSLKNFYYHMDFFLKTLNNVIILIGKSMFRTHEESKNDFEEMFNNPNHSKYVGDEYELLSEYVKAHDKVKIKHKKCGQTFSMRPYNFKNGHRCDECSRKKYINKRRKNGKEDFIEYVKNTNEYELISEYKNSQTKVKLLHSKCGKIYEVKPYSFKLGHRCNHCSVTNSENAKIKFENLFNNSEYELLSEYTNNQTKVKVLHKKCGTTFHIKPYSFSLNHGCPKCGLKRGSMIKKEKAKKDFEEMFNNPNHSKYVGDEYELLSEYVKAHDKVKIKHKKCGTEFYIRPNNFKMGSRCNQCSGNNKNKSKKEFYEYMKKRPEYELLSEYKNSHNKIKILHKTCGYEFKTPPYVFKRGVGCPKCARNNNELVKQDFKERFDNPNHSEYVGDKIILLSEYKNSKSKLKFQCLKCGKKFEKSYNQFLKLPKCPCQYPNHHSYGSGESARKKYYEDVILKFENIKPLFSIDEYKGTGESNKYKWKCELCGKEFIQSIHYRKKIPKCTCQKSKYTKRQKKVLQIIENEKDIEFIEFDHKNKTPSLKYKHSCGTINHQSLSKFISGQRCGNKKCRYEKQKNTNLKKYGVKNVSRLKTIKEKKKKTTLNHYGVENPFQAKEIRKKSEKTMMKKYGVKHNIYMRKHINSSKVEKEFQKFIESYIDIEKNKRIYVDGRYKELDIYIPSKNFGIEVNGLYWHSEKSGEKSKHYHIEKLEYFNSQNINYFQFTDWEWKNKQEIVKSMITSKLGLCERIYARKCDIKDVGTTESFEFLNQNHIQGGIHSSIRLGLYYDNQLVALMTFGKPRFSKKYDWELHRYVSKMNKTVVGGFSKILSHFRKNHEGTIVSYADRRYSVGNVYEKNGFELSHISDPNYYYFNLCDDRTLFHRSAFQKHKLEKKLDRFDPKLTEWENMQMNGYDRIWDCGNLVFVLN